MARAEALLQDNSDGMAAAAKRAHLFAAVSGRQTMEFHFSLGGRPKDAAGEPGDAGSGNGWSLRVRG